MDELEFEKFAHQICHFLIDYKTNVGKNKITPGVKPGFLWSHLDKTVTDWGEDFSNVFEDFRDKVLPGIVNWNHPMNFSIFPSPNNFPSVLGDMLSTCLGGPGFAWKSCPSLTELENLMCDWYAHILALPDKFSFEGSYGKGGGAYQQTTTDVLYNILMCSRYRALKKLKKQYRTKDKYQFMSKLVVYASKECHFAIRRLCRIEGIEFRAISIDTNSAMSTDDLEKHIKEDVENKLVPILVIATIGSFVKFGVDDIEEIHNITRNHHTIWLHADASYGGNAMMLKRYHYMRNGLKEVNSVAASPHKWLQVGLDCPVLWVRNASKYKRVFLVSAAYLVSEKKEAIDLRHYGIALTRRFRALKMWFVFRTYGTKELEMKIRIAMHMARRFSRALEKEPAFEVVYEEFTFVNFVLKNADDEKNKSFYEALMKTRQILLLPVDFNGKYTLRFSATYVDTKPVDIGKAINLLKSTASSFS